jgi:hypothetical protein
MNRRSFLRSGSAATAGLLLPTAARATDPDGRPWPTHPTPQLPSPFSQVCALGQTGMSQYPGQPPIFYYYGCECDSSTKNCVPGTYCGITSSSPLTAGPCGTTGQSCLPTFTFPVAPSKSLPTPQAPNIGLPAGRRRHFFADDLPNKGLARKAAADFVPKFLTAPHGPVVSFTKVPHQFRLGSETVLVMVYLVTVQPAGTPSPPTIDVNVGLEVEALPSGATASNFTSVTSQGGPWGHIGVRGDGQTVSLLIARR